MLALQIVTATQSATIFGLALRSSASCAALRAAKAVARRRRRTPATARAARLQVGVGERARPSSAEQRRGRAGATQDGEPRAERFAIAPVRVVLGERRGGLEPRPIAAAARGGEQRQRGVAIVLEVAVLPGQRARDAAARPPPARAPRARRRRRARRARARRPPRTAGRTAAGGSATESSAAACRDTP